MCFHQHHHHHHHCHLTKKKKQKKKPDGWFEALGVPHFVFCFSMENICWVCNQACFSALKSLLPFASQVPWGSACCSSDSCGFWCCCRHCCCSDFLQHMRTRGSRGQMPTSAAAATDDQYEQQSTDGSSSTSSTTLSMDGLASEQMLGDTGDDVSCFGHTNGAEDVTSSSSDRSLLPLGWPVVRPDQPSGKPSPSSLSELNRHPFMWEEKREKRQTVLSGT